MFKEKVSTYFRFKICSLFITLQSLHEAEYNLWISYGPLTWSINLNGLKKLLRGWVVALEAGQTIDCFEFQTVFRAVVMGRTWLYDFQPLTRNWRDFNDPRMWRGLLCVGDGGGDGGHGQDGQEQHQEDSGPASPLPGHPHRGPDLPWARHPGQPHHQHRPQHQRGGETETSQEGENCGGE